MKNFTNINNSTYSFSSCEICKAQCCSGVGGTVFSQLLLEDFKTVSKHFPILFTFGELGYLKAVVLLTNGKDYCPYLKDFRCSIYDERPSICKTYPLSPQIDDNIYVDLNCPAVCSDGTFTMVQNGEITAKYQHENFVNYQDKYIQTHQELEKFNCQEEFEKVIIINNIEFFKYIKTTSNKYMNYHIDSLLNLKNLEL